MELLFIYNETIAALLMSKGDGIAENNTESKLVDLRNNEKLKTG